MAGDAANRGSHLSIIKLWQQWSADEPGDGLRDNLPSTWNLQVHLLHRISSYSIIEEAAFHRFMQKVNMHKSESENRLTEWHDPNISSISEAPDVDPASQKNVWSVHCGVPRYLQC